MIIKATTITSNGKQRYFAGTVWRSNDVSSLLLDWQDFYLAAGLSQMPSWPHHEVWIEECVLKMGGVDSTLIRMSKRQKGAAIMACAKHMPTPVHAWHEFCAWCVKYTLKAILKIKPEAFIALSGGSSADFIGLARRNHGVRISEECVAPAGAPVPYARAA